jgi:hypothetical protein
VRESPKDEEPSITTGPSPGGRDLRTCGMTWLTPFDISLCGISARTWATDDTTVRSTSPAIAPGTRTRRPRSGAPAGERDPRAPGGKCHSHHRQYSCSPVTICVDGSNRSSGCEDADCGREEPHREESTRGPYTAAQQQHTQPSIVALRGGLSVAALLRGGQRTRLLRRAVDGPSSIRHGEARCPHGPRARVPVPLRSPVPRWARPQTTTRPRWSRYRAPTDVGAAPGRERPTR